MLPINFAIEGFRQAEKRGIVFLVFHTKASKFSREWRLGFADKYMENQNLYMRLSSRDFISQNWSVNSLGGVFSLLFIEIAEC